jgi:NhaP-type Na+/H+ or K+/H+ antiporter
VGLAGIVVLGIAAQWLAWGLKLPSILFLLLVGILAGPVTGFIEPDKLLGDLLMPVVSLSVALILFEGGLTLQLKELREIGKSVWNLVTIGVLITWIVATAAAYYILDLHFNLAILLGAMLVVTGPTVIGPLLQLIRPSGRVGNLIKWEGIAIDPIGVLLAVLVFECVKASHAEEAAHLVAEGIALTVLLGGAIGVISAVLLVVLLKRYWIPDFLQETFTLMLVLVTFLLSNHFQEESGLFAVTLMGIILANQKKVAVHHIVAFKENLRVLIISSVFIILAARLQRADLGYIDWRCWLFLAVLIIVARPAAVIISTIASPLTWKERLFLSWMAPRGIVAAAVSSVFALQLEPLGMDKTELLVPVTFMVIIGTVALYGLTAPLLARKLGLSQANPQGILIIGAHSWARAIAKAIQDEGFNVLLVDTNRTNESKARMEGFKTYPGSILSEHVTDEIDLSGLGKLMALTPNDEANSLAALHFAHLFGREDVYQLCPWQDDKKEEDKSPRHLRGRFLFGPDANYAHLNRRFSAGAVIKITKITEAFTYADFQDRYGTQALPLFLIEDSRTLSVTTRNNETAPKAGQTLVALIDEQTDG